jgi:hypothetical protein
MALGLHRLFSAQILTLTSRNFLLRLFSPAADSHAHHRSVLATVAKPMSQRIGKSLRQPGATSKARAYADVNVVRPAEYWDYENLSVNWGY